MPGGWFSWSRWLKKNSRAPFAIRNAVSCELMMPYNCTRWHGVHHTAHITKLRER